MPPSTISTTFSAKGAEPSRPNLPRAATEPTVQHHCSEQ
ncbi:hypothetical protein MGSAQ_001714 [marine sediment metagenome]|uniref:Uncharacterized protein n=1 Tax=marine sediment metagenome TaxID=412755 RepID=A0A1B6NTH4_9ZZZZ